MTKLNWKDEELIRGACKGASSQREILRRLGLPISGACPRTLKKYAALYDIELPHGSNDKATEAVRIDLDKILVENSTYASFGRLKIRLVREGLLEYTCSKCGCSDWMGDKISLQLDHINGNRTDNRLENLRFLCPNCHSQTDTWGRKIRKD